jgi:hypothetical protein
LLKNKLQAPRHSGIQELYSSTTTVIGYIEKKHKINQNGPMPTVSLRNTQRTIESFDSLIIQRNEAITEFYLSTFKVILVRLFTVEQLAIAKVEPPSFRELLIYLQPDLRSVENDNVEIHGWSFIWLSIVTI